MIDNPEFNIRQREALRRMAHVTRIILAIARQYRPFGQRGGAQAFGVNAGAFHIRLLRRIAQTDGSRTGPFGQRSKDRRWITDGYYPTQFWQLVGPRFSGRTVV